MKRTKLGHKLNWVRPKSKPHPSLRLVRTPDLLPVKVDLRPGDTPIFDQGTEGSCTMNAGCGLYDYLVKGAVVTSRQFGYYSELEIDGNLGTDAGSSLATCAVVFNMRGVCLESLCPYNSATMFERPPIEAWNDALTRKISERVSIPQDLNSMKQCLSEGNPFIYGMSVFDSFETAPNGVVPMPEWLARSLGGHALMIVGYDDFSKRFIGRNSWGTDWGDKGYFTIPYRYLTNPKLADDFWTFRL